LWKWIVSENFPVAVGQGRVQGRLFRYPKQNGQERVKDAEKTGAERLVTSCPFCYQGLQIGINALKSKLKMTDLSELVALSMELKRRLNLSTITMAA